MNPCPCGYHGDATGRCRCSPERIQQYRHRLSGPLLDRIDMHIEVPALPRAELVRRQPDSAETSAAVRERVGQARAIAMARTGSPNSALQGEALEQHCRVSEEGRQLLEQAIARLGLSARAYHRLLKIARTIADLARNETIETAHLAEAVQLRCFDRTMGT